MWNKSISCVTGDKVTLCMHHGQHLEFLINIWLSIHWKIMLNFLNRCEQLNYQAIKSRNFLKFKTIKPYVPTISRGLQKASWSLGLLICVIYKSEAYWIRTVFVNKCFSISFRKFSVKIWAMRADKRRKCFMEELHNMI